MQRALELYIPIACTGPDFGFKYMVGTGFPVSADLVMTAKHINCGDNNITEISYDHGKTWEWIHPQQMYTSENWDVRIYKSALQHDVLPAKFREPILGENSTGYGIAFNVTSTVGRVVRSDSTGLHTSNTAIGGMSGSAIVADDGTIIGMTVQAHPAFVGYTPTAYLSYGIPGPKLKQVLTYLKAIIYAPSISPNHTETEPPQAEAPAPHGFIAPVPLPQLPQ